MIVAYHVFIVNTDDVNFLIAAFIHRKPVVNELVYIQYMHIEWYLQNMLILSGRSLADCKDRLHKPKLRRVVR